MAKKSVLSRKEIEQRTEQEQEEQSRVLIPNPRKLLLGFTNPHLASEFGYHMAKHTSMKVLVIDADGLNPIVSACLGMKELVNSQIQSDGDSDSAFNMAMEYISRTPKRVADVFKKIAVEHPSNKNLFVLTGNDDVQKFEDYSETTFELLLKQATESFDLVLVNVPYNIYDAFYLTALDHVEYMIYGFGAYADSLMTFNALVDFLHTCGRSDIQKHQFVAFEYSSSKQLSMHDVKLAVDHHVLGYISEEKARDRMRNEFNKAYSKNMSKKNTKEYHRLAKTFGYQTKISFFKRKFR
jgi:cellulose biosynthesis protein BcsQ